jgi:putative spermidine/putrescine transport system permease protein
VTHTDGPARSNLRQRFVIALFAAAMLLPYALLLVLSLGSGWTFPRLLPDRIDFAPWRYLVLDRDGMLRSIATSVVMSLFVATVATAGGLVIARAVRSTRSTTLRFLMYVPFVVSPVIIGICLYDLLVRLHLAGSLAGVVFAQSIVAQSFAAVFFSELWSHRTDRLKLLVRQFGGSPRDVWRHAVWPQMSGLIVICFVQTALYSWVDFGLVSVLGGGRVPTVTTRVFAYIREASMNQAAMSGLILLVPALAGIALTAAIVRRRSDHNTLPLPRNPR